MRKILLAILIAAVAITTHAGLADARSIAIKGQWAREHGLRGLMYWECSEDDDNRSLAYAVWNAVM